jgi:hypothetical protein
LPAAAALVGGAGTRVIDQDAAHRSGRGSQEVIPGLERLVPDEPQVRLANQGGGVEGVPGGLGRHPRGGELPQFVVHETAPSDSNVIGRVVTLQIHAQGTEDVVALQPLVQRHGRDPRLVGAEYGDDGRDEYRRRFRPRERHEPHMGARHRSTS